jgi:hypothetical protein
MKQELFSKSELETLWDILLQHNDDMDDKVTNSWQIVTNIDEL